MRSHRRICCRGSYASVMQGQVSVSHALHEKQRVMLWARTCACRSVEAYNYFEVLLSFLTSIYIRQYKNKIDTGLTQF